MKKNPVYSALRLIFRNLGGSLPILNYGLIEHGWLRYTDIEHQLKVFVGDQNPKPVLADVGLYIKTGDLPAAMDAAKNIDINEYPAEVIIDAPETAINPQVLDGLIDLIPAAGTDDARECLKCVFVNHAKKEAVATDGHLLLLKKISVAPKESFMIGATSLKIISCFETGQISRVTLQHKMKKEADGKSSIDGTFICVIGNGWQLVTKSPHAKDYPEYHKAIPDRSKSEPVLWNAALQAEVNTFLEKAKPFTNPKTHMVFMTAREGVVKNKELSFLRRMVFTKKVLALQPEQVFGCNGEILQKVLRFIGNQPANVTIGDTMVQAVVLHGEKFLVLLMPLKTTESGWGISRSELLQDENGRIIPMPVQNSEVEMRKAA